MNNFIVDILNKKEIIITKDVQDQGKFDDRRWRTIVEVISLR